VTFRTGHKKCVFGTVVEPGDGHTTESVVTLRWPDHLQQIQRRLFERAQPPQGTVIPVRLWREGSSAGPREEVRSIRHGQLEDLSAGGMRVKAHDASEFHAGRTYRCVFTPRAGGPSIVVDAFARHRQAADQGRASIGFQFVGLEATPEGRRVLARIARTVSQFQRARSRSRSVPVRAGCADWCSVRRNQHDRRDAGPTL
jgi:c-di-GMP-binding flagellar brake protein YcgR